MKKALKRDSRLSNQKCKPDLVLCSSAIRAKQTAEIAHSKGNWKSVFFLEPNIYGGDPYYLINLIKEQDKRYSSICLVGHEPNFSAFISKAINTTSYIEFTTAAMAKIDFDIKEWSKIDFGTINLNFNTLETKFSYGNIYNHISQFIKIDQTVNSSNKKNSINHFIINIF